MTKFYCTYEAEMPADAVRGSLVDRSYRGEIDVDAATAAEAKEKVKQHIAKSHPGDTLISCECEPF